MAKKRKLDEILNVEESLAVSESDESSNGTDSSTDVPASKLVAPSAKATGCVANQNKKSKRSVNFKCVTVYSFPRTQGFTCVPSEGGSTLGMASEHSCEETYTLAEYSRTKKRVHQLILYEQQQAKSVVNSSYSNNGISNINQQQQQSGSESDHSDEDSQSDDDTDLELDDYYFLQPVSIRQRRTLLRSAGVKKIDGNEKDECRQIRVSREVCGCDCKVYCDPERCACCLAGIKCQVDRLSFPCSCTKDGCANTHGRIEFNPIRVRTHFIHTLMRMELEKKDIAHANDMAIDNPNENNDSLSCSAVDVSELNSNERGSCRDCQNSEVCHVMMREAEAQYARTLQEERQSFMSSFLAQDEFNINHISSVAAPENHTCSGTNNAHANGLLLYSNNGSDSAAFYNTDNMAAMGMYEHQAVSELKSDDQGSYSESSDSSAENSADGCCNDSVPTQLSNLITSSEDMSEFSKSYQDSYSSAVRSGTAVNFSSHNGESGGGINPPAVGETRTPDLSSSTNPSLYKLAGVLSCESYADGDTITETPWNHEGAAAIDIEIDRNSNTGLSEHVTGTEQASLTQTAACSYTTMTNTTSDRLAKNCPLISTHMLKKQVGSVFDSSDEKPVPSEIDMRAAFSPISALTNVTSAASCVSSDTAASQFIFNNTSVQMIDSASHTSDTMTVVSVASPVVTRTVDPSTVVSTPSDETLCINQISNVSRTEANPVNEHLAMNTCVSLLNSATDCSSSLSPLSLSSSLSSSHQSSVIEASVNHNAVSVSEPGVVSEADTSHLSNSTPFQQQQHDQACQEGDTEQRPNKDNEQHKSTVEAVVKQNHVTTLLEEHHQQLESQDVCTASNQVTILQHQRRRSCDECSSPAISLTSDIQNGFG